MKILKKFVVTLILVALLGTLVAVPASAEVRPAANILASLGILKGTGNGVDEAYCASQQTRYQVAWIFLRLLGKEAEALAWTGTSNFKDAADAKNTEGNTLNAENIKILSYLYNNKELGFRGYADDTFRPFEQMDKQMYYKLMLVSLGYVEDVDFDWYNVFNKSFEYDLTSQTPRNSDGFTISELADITVRVLKSLVRGGEKTLITKLVEDDKAIPAANAERVGLYYYHYSTLMDPLFNKEDTVNVGPPESASYLLPEKYTGHVTIKFDMTSIVPNPDASVSFMTSPAIPLNHKDTDSHYYSHHSIMLAMSDGRFRAIDGSNWSIGPSFKMNTTYHVRIEANMIDHNYSIFVQEDGGAEQQIGSTLNFRTRGFVQGDPANEYVQYAEDIAMVVVAGIPLNGIYMENLVVTDDTP